MIQRLILLFSLLYLPLILWGQGCADAGFCSVGAMQTGVHKLSLNKQRNSVGFSTSVASGEKLSWVISPQLETKIVIAKNSFFEARLPYNIITGNLGTNRGLGDVISTFTSELNLDKTKSKLNLRYTIGTRIGLRDASDSLRGLPLPMAYQLSTGTTDLIVGLSTNIGKHFTVALGMQQPLIHYNRNGYYTTQNRDSSESVYFSSINLRRKGDALLRIEARKDWKHTGIHGGTLLLYHLGEDNITLTNGTNLKLSGSSGMTINMNFVFYYRADNWIFDFTLAAPVLARKNRPDGLTRNAVATPRILLML